MWWQPDDRVLLLGELDFLESSFLSTYPASCARNTTSVASAGCKSRLSHFALRVPLVVGEPAKIAATAAIVDVLHLELAS